MYKNTQKPTNNTFKPLELINVWKNKSIVILKLPTIDTHIKPYKVKYKLAIIIKAITNIDLNKNIDVVILLSIGSPLRFKQFNNCIFSNIFTPPLYYIIPC